MKYTAGAATTVYPSRYYNIKGTERIKHVYAGDQLIATIKGTGASALVYSVSTDHLTGSNVVTNSSGTVEELVDYYPYGDIRLDEKAGTFSEQRKFTGHEYDADTGLSYMNARYYNGKIGRFVSQDPLVLKNPEKVLEDPQSLNYYAYSRNNPLRFIDPTGLYNIETGRVEKGDTPDIIVNSINKTFGINTNWETVQQVSFYKDNFGEKTLDQIVGKSLFIGKNITADITDRLNGLNQSRSNIANLLGKGSLTLFAPHSPWDIKNSSDPILGGGQKNREYWSYIYKGELIRLDAPGNINYGYVAKSLGLSSFAIQGGARLEQMGDDLLSGKISFSDNYGDSKYIQMGIDSYKPNKSWWQKLLN